jgi:hypothetical protein
MIYIIAVILGLLECVKGFLSEVTKGNIIHLKNGRRPNAGAALFPSIPFVPFFYVVIAWALRVAVHGYAVWILIGLFLIQSLFWVFSFRKLSAELRRIEDATNQTHDDAA